MNLDIYSPEIVALNKEMLSARSAMSPDYISISSKFVKKAKETDDSTLLGYAYYYLTDAYYLMSTDYRKFNTNLLNAIEYLQMGDDNEHLARCYNLLGIDALNHGNLELALDFFFNGLVLCDELENTGIPGFMEFNMGHVFYRLGDIKRAIASVKSAAKHIRKNKEEALFVRNILYCYCFEANCQIELGKEDAVRKCLEGIDKLEASKEGNPEFFSTYAVIDTRMRSYHFLGDNKKFKEYLDVLMDMIIGGKYTLDNLDDVFDTVRFCLSIGMLDRARDIIVSTEKSLEELSIANLKLSHARLRCELHETYNDTKSAMRAYKDFYKYSLECEKEKLLNYQFFANYRQKLFEIEKENMALSKRAETDPLTGLGNRYGLNKYADYAFDLAFENKKSLAVEILDVDDFKHYNDTYGHQCGDSCLKRIGEIIADLCRSNKAIHAYRYGGDEFVIIYENMTDDEVMEYAMKLRSDVIDMKLTGHKNSEKSKVTISQGIRNSIPAETNKLWDYMYAADNALYEVKKNGKGEIAIIHKAAISPDSFDESVTLNSVTSAHSSDMA